jgi:hypothetical protein
MYTQVLFFFSITCLNVSSLVDTAEVVDTFLGHWVHGGSSALQFLWNNTGLHIHIINWSYEMCSEEMMITGECVPFLDYDGVLLTMGYAITFMIFFPMALMDLKVRRNTEAYIT